MSEQILPLDKVPMENSGSEIISQTNENTSTQKLLDSVTKLTSEFYDEKRNDPQIPCFSTFPLSVRNQFKKKLNFTFGLNF